MTALYLFLSSKSEVDDGVEVELGEDGVVGGEEAVVEALDDRHGEDDEAVLVGLEGAAEEVGDIPDDGRLFGDVRADGGDLVGRRLGKSGIFHESIIAIMANCNRGARRSRDVWRGRDVAMRRYPERRGGKCGKRRCFAGRYRRLSTLYSCRCLRSYCRLPLPAFPLQK